MKNNLKVTGTTLLLTVVLWLQAAAADINITQYGAKGDGRTSNTKAIQRAVDACTKTGGTVRIPQGKFITGTIYLKSNVTLYLEKGATLLGSLDSLEYPNNEPTTVKCWSTHSRNGKPRPNLALIYAEDQNNIAIQGEGTINGQGGAKQYVKGDNGHGRPKNIFFISCRNVVVKDVLLTNSPFWMQDYLGCDGVNIDGIRVVNHSNWNNDGLDIDSRNVRVTNCTIDSDDDGICLKSYLNDKPCENVTITNCVVASNCDAVKMGTPGYGGFKNIAISNIAVRASEFDNFRHWQSTDKHILAKASMVNGISIECVDGGSTENIVIDNITMKGTQNPIFIRVGNRRDRMNDDKRTGISSMRNVIISNIIGEQLSRRSSSITAIPGAYVENVKLSHILLDIYSDGTKEDAAMEVPEKENGYPSPHMFGATLPAYGFYLRHVKNITFNDVQFNLLGKDERPPLVMDDVHYTTLNDVQVKTTDGKTTALQSAGIKQINSNDTWLDHKELK